MPIDDFSQNRSFMLPADGADRTAIKRMLDRYGEEVTKGYLMAFHDLLPELEFISKSTNKTRMRDKAFDLCRHIEGILELHSEYHNDGARPKGSSGAPFSSPS